MIILGCGSDELKERYVLAKSGVNLRSNPDVNSKILVSIPKNKIVFINLKKCIFSNLNEEKYCWYQSRYLDQTDLFEYKGWIYSLYLGDHIEQVRNSGYWKGNKFIFIEASERGILEILDTDFLPESQDYYKFVSGSISFKEKKFKLKDGSFHLKKEILVKDWTGTPGEYYENRMLVSGKYRNNKLEGQIKLKDYLNDSVDLYYNYEAAGLFVNGYCKSFEISGILGHRMKKAKIKISDPIEYSHKYLMSLMWDTVE
ncbi:SH3 domain-containing protein [Leptospira sp. GIMC2001]|uniref:SH3 domain-containing protein n=1 Tax=Leptospira sp. GIMC2001 TaxID=1513297 RepID=UPI00234998B1|nr:SH3 domain-containing protein [Leptospira sp. GIMC2001]WCL50667.1 SH3 domain-containing protein [Leptospira sp. GIMC2001]